MEAGMSTTSTTNTMPLDMVGSTAFGRYAKISLEETFNMIISDDFLVPYAGYKSVATINTGGRGRGLYSSRTFQHMIAVVENGVYIINRNLAVSRIGSLKSFTGDVFIAENNANQIAICDKSKLYIFNYETNTFSQVALDFIPGYVSFQNGYFIAPESGTSEWRLSAENNGLSWPPNPENVGEFQTKADQVLAPIPLPGKSNTLFLFGGTVTESWKDTGQSLFPYVKDFNFNIDYGCLNPATIALGDDIVVWLGANEKSGPVIMFSQGGEPQQISNDGINFRFAQLTNPRDAYGFLFKQDGHLLYQFTFPSDNLSMALDFNTKRFFTLSDQYMNHHIAKRVVYFNNSYYFVSFNDGKLYELSSNYTDLDGVEMPCIRVCKSKRLPDSKLFSVQELNFTLEQGDDDSTNYVDFAMSSDGGETFSSFYRTQLNPLGKRLNRFVLNNLGAHNDFIPQFRFVGRGRAVATNGEVKYYT
jgi:hypothetical protein